MIFMNPSVSDVDVDVDVDGNDVGVVYVRIFYQVFRNLLELHSASPQFTSLQFN